MKSQLQFAFTLVRLPSPVAVHILRRTYSLGALSAICCTMYGVRCLLSSWKLQRESQFDQLAREPDYKTGHVT